MTKLTAPLFTVGCLVTKTEKSSLVMFWTVEEVLATQGTYSYKLVPYKHKYEHLGGWEMEKNLALVEKPGQSTPKFNIDDLVIYGSNIAPYTVTRIVEDDVGGFRYYLHGTGGGGATWAYEKDMAKAKQVAQKVFDDRATPAMQIGTLTHANIELQHKLDALQNKYNDLRYDDEKIKNTLRDLKHKLSWTLNCDANEASIFAKVDHIKNLAFNPARFRIGDEVQFRHDLLNVSHPLSTVTKVKETLPQQDGSYQYKLEAKTGGEYMVVKEADLRPVIRGPVDVVDIYIIG